MKEGPIFESFDKRLSAAKRRVADLDKIDGWKPRDIATIISALEAGLKEPTTDAAFEALVMLQDHFDTLIGKPTGATLLMTTRPRNRN